MIKVCLLCRYSLRLADNTFLCTNRHSPRLSDYVRKASTCPKWELEKKEDEQ